MVQVVEITRFFAILVYARIGRRRSGEQIKDNRQHKGNQQQEQQAKFNLMPSQLEEMQKIQDSWFNERQQLQSQLEDSRQQQMKAHQELQKLTHAHKQALEKMKHHARDLRTPKSAYIEQSPRSPLPGHGGQSNMPWPLAPPQQQQSRNKPKPEPLAFPDDTSSLSRH